MNPKEFKADCERKAKAIGDLIELGKRIEPGARVGDLTAIDPIMIEIFAKHRAEGLSIKAAYRLTIDTPEGTA